MIYSFSYILIILYILSKKKEIHMGSYMMQAKYPEIIKELIIKAKFDITAATSLSLTEKKKACIFIFSIWLAIFK